MLAMLADLHRPADGPDTGAEGEDGADPAVPRVVVEVAEGERLVVPGLEGRLTQVFQNLIANALSFSPPGGTVRVRARRDGGAARITVSDDGPGIPEGKERAIFERFYTERPAGEKFGTHSGLGLSIAQQIVRVHDGDLYARNRLSSDGRIDGADFTVTLPLFH